MQVSAAVGQLGRIVPVVLALVLWSMPARAAVLIHEYALRGSLADNKGGPALTALGGKITELGYIFAENQGLLLNSSSLTMGNFSFEFSMKVDSTAGFAKIIDFYQLTTNTGLYQQNGMLHYLPGGPATPVDFAAGATVHLVLTRDNATGLLTGYVNGQQRFAFTDNTLVPPFSDQRINFFVDDTTTGQLQATSGALNYLRVFNGALTSGEVSALYAAGPPLAVPEPSTFALLLAGTVTLWMTSRRRRKRS